LLNILNPLLDLSLLFLIRQLQENQLNGTIPTELGKLARLTTL